MGTIDNVVGEDMQKTRYIHKNEPFNVDNEILFISENNFQIITKRLNECGYTWESGDKIDSNDLNDPGIFIHTDAVNKSISYSERIYISEIALNYIILDSEHLVEKHIYSEYFELQPNKFLLITKNNEKIIGDYLAQHGYRFGFDKQFERDVFHAGMIIKLAQENKRIGKTYLEPKYIDEYNIVNYIFTKVDL